MLTLWSCLSYGVSVLQHGLHFQALVAAADVPAIEALLEGNPCYDLAVGSGPSQERMQRQRDAIEAELQRPYAQLALAQADMPYNLRTVPSKGYCPEPIQMEVRRSNLPNRQPAEAVLLGVYPKHPQPAVRASPWAGGAARRAALSVPPTHEVWRPSKLEPLCIRAHLCCVCLCLPALWCLMVGGWSPVRCWTR